MRTDAEILAHVDAVSSRDWMGTMSGDLLNRLPFDAVRKRLTKGATAEDWGEPSPRDADSVKKEMLEYMPFAWEKANNRRGISAGRSLDHMSAWLWLLGYDEAANLVLDYDLYGKPRLRAICELFGWDWREWDDGLWANNEESKGHPPPESVSKLPMPEEVA